jgi:hypothetical protein
VLAAGVFAAGAGDEDDDPEFPQATTVAVRETAIKLRATFQRRIGNLR